MSVILVIDDMAIFRDPIAASLRLAGYITLRAENGAEGLAILRNHHPDLILLDVSMPVLDGMSFLRVIRHDPSLATTPVILLTALVDRNFIIEAGKLGVRDYLLKSRFSLAELLERVKRACPLDSLPPVAPAPVVSSPVAPTTLASATVTSATELKTSDADTESAPRSEAAPVRASRPAEPPPASQPQPVVLEEITPLLDRQQCVSRVEALMAGRTLSGSVAEVLMLAGRPSAELKDLSALITRDPVLSVRVLQMANSAAFLSRRGAVSTITEAVKNIGASNVRNIAASVGIFDAMPASSPDGFNPIRCWQHSFAVAKLCEVFTAPTAPDEAGVAYLVGLCHELGEIMFRTQFESEYKLVLDLQQRTTAPLSDIERRVLGMTHLEIMKVVLNCIGLPGTIRIPIEQFHASSKPTSNQPIVSRALAIAENYANGLLLASSESSMVSPITQTDWMTISGKSRLSLPDGAEIRSQVYWLTAILSRLNSADQAALMKTPYQRANVAVWVARDPAFSKADPMVEAMRELANVEVQDRLPTPEESKKIAGLVIEGRGPNVPGWSLPDIEKCTISNPKLARLWLTNVDSSNGGDPQAAPLRSASLRAVQSFIEQACSSTLRAAA